MKKISTHTLIILPIALVIISLNTEFAHAQYCSPSFTNGCTSWSNKSLTIDAFTWVIGSSSCTASDYTSDTAHLDTGTPYLTVVTNGDWCGCGLWIDLNNDMVFDTSESFYHVYTANQVNIYSFNMTIPSSVPTGTYRMRLIAGWGSDCYNPSANGYGPCGSYEYGNFDDFSVKVTNISTGIAQNPATGLAVLKVSPNPATDFITVTLSDYHAGAFLNITDAIGKTIRMFPVTKNKETIDVSELSHGIYFLNYIDGEKHQCIKIAK